MPVQGMQKVPLEAIQNIPDEIHCDNRDNLQEAADTSLFVLFFMGNEYEPQIAWPPIISNGAEVWRLPSPWQRESQGDETTCNDANELVAHIKRNAIEYNKALDKNDRPVAERIAASGPSDAASIWDQCNSLAHTIAKSQGEGIYRNLDISEATTDLFEVLINPESA